MGNGNEYVRSDLGLAAFVCPTPAEVGVVLFRYAGN